MYIYPICGGKHSTVGLRGVAGCVQVSVHTSNTVIISDLSKYFTWQKWALG